jgi:hypothetical protein
MKIILLLALAVTSVVALPSTVDHKAEKLDAASLQVLFEQKLKITYCIREYADLF